MDGQGRRFGNVPWHGKGRTAEKIPNKRTRQMHEAFDLRGRTVLEIGCFEGAHTLGLCRLGAQVTAIDSRVENVVKTIVRTACFDHHPRVFVCDVERRPLPVDHLRAEFCHHVGVLYHLADPVTHLLELGSLIGRGLLLDTHYAADGEATERYEVSGESFAYQPLRRVRLRGRVVGDVRPLQVADARHHPPAAATRRLRSRGVDVHPRRVAGRARR